MANPLNRPSRKNPIVKTRLPTLPPTTRGRFALGLTAAATEGRFELQVCADCGAVQYPPREACNQCLSVELKWTPQSGAGELIATTVLHHSNDLFYRDRMPWRIGMVRLDAANDKGPSVVAHLHGDVGEAPSRVRLTARLDRSGQAVIYALPEKETPNMADDPQYRETTCDPKFRKVLVTDGKTALGQAVVKALAAAGADLIWVGQAEPWKMSPGLDKLREFPQVAIVPLDVTDADSVNKLAAEIGGKVDIVVNTAELHRSGGIGDRDNTDTARREMDVNYFGLLRLGQSFGGAMKFRAADGQSSAVAWVNLLSIYALSNFAPHGTYSASKAAALSLSQCLRTELGAAGVRVINVFPGPIDDEWNQLLPPPKLGASVVASAIVKALKDGVEDVYPGDVAQEWLTKYRENPKVLELELRGGGM